MMFVCICSFTFAIAVRGLTMKFADSHRMLAVAAPDKNLSMV
jgi:hypothetical protein